VLFEKAYSSSVGGFPDGGAIAADGGALLMGRNVIDIFVKHDAWVVRVDAAGQVLWSERFGAAGAGKFFLFDAAQLADGSWIAVGSASVTDFPPQHAWVLRLASEGVPLWQYEYGGGIQETARAVTPTADGGFVIAGSSNSSGAGSDHEGELGDFGSVVVPLSGAGFLVGGTWGWGFEGESLWLERTDNAGGLAGCDVDRTTAFALMRPAVTAQNGTALRSPGTAMLQSVGAQSAASAAVVTELCR
jgi:hypothetical protein